LARAAKAEPPAATKPIETGTKPSGATLEFCGLGKVTVDADDPSAARTGWSATRVRELTEQRDALMQVSMSDADINLKEDWSCTAVGENNTHMRRRAQVGELAALREQLEASGKTASELAQKHRAWMEKIRERGARDAPLQQEEAALAP